MRNVQKNSTNTLMSKHRFKFKLWYIPIIIVLILVILLASLYGYVNVKLHSEGGNNAKTVVGPPIIQKKQKSKDIENILIAGIDMGPSNDISHRTDAMCIANFDNKTNTLKLASILRDIKVYFPEKKFYGKLNASYNYGGINETVNMINSNFDLDIQKYIVINFDGFSKIIDSVGGVPITLSAKEASYSYINVGKTAGTYLLDGAHALGYVRTRYIDTDFERTQRQRNVIMALLKKTRNQNISSKIAFTNECLNYVTTNIPTSEITKYVLSSNGGKNIKNVQQCTIPSMDDGLYTTEKHPQWYWDLNWPAEREKLHNFLYNK